MILNFAKRALAKTLERLSPLRPKRLTKAALEELLLECDLAFELVEEIIYYLPPAETVKKEDLQRVLLSYFDPAPPQPTNLEGPVVELILGVNGAGKTTTIAKLAKQAKARGERVLLAAGDTFRAGAVEQLRLWATRLGVDFLASAQGQDPASVAFDAVSKARAKNFDRILIDTAGRLENQKNLAEELAKIIRSAAKAAPDAPQRKILILDGTQGRAGLAQARGFNELAGLDGLIITKLDGSARGGAIFSVARELGLAILYIGLGEGEDDLAEFEPEAFVGELVDFIFGEE